MKLPTFKHEYLSCTECDFHLYSTPDTDYKYDWRCRRCGYERNSGFTVHGFTKNYLEDNFTFPIPYKSVPNKYLEFEAEIDKLGHPTWLKVDADGVFTYAYAIKVDTNDIGWDVYNKLFDVLQDVIMPFRFETPRYSSVIKSQTWPGSYEVRFVLRAEHVRRQGRELTSSDKNLVDGWSVQD